MDSTTAATAGSNSLTRAVAGFVAGFPQLGLPPAALGLAREAFTDLVGVMLAGAREPVAKLLTGYTAAAVGAGSCSVLLDAATRRSAVDAALINGSAAHALDYDDVQFNAHPSTVLVPAILAEAERSGASGRDALRAYVLGYEVWGELHGREPHPYHDKGWHPTAALGTAAATAAVACLRGLDATTTQHALSLAASFTGGVVANFGAMAKPLHAGRAAAAAITAVELAVAGITAGEDGLGGLLTALSPLGQVDLKRVSRLGERWFSLEAPPMFKKYPVCFSTHRPLDALLRMVEEEGLRADGVEMIQVEVRGTQARVLRFDRPRTALEAKFSMQFAAACALLRGGVGLADLDDGFVASAPMQALMRKVRLIHRGPGPDGKPAIADRVVVTLAGGRVLDSGEITAVAPHRRLREKFLDCCEAGGYPHGPRLFAALEGLEQQADLRGLAA
jgi:aconitate decarboxylase